MPSRNVTNTDVEPRKEIRARRYVGNYPPVEDFEDTGMEEGAGGEGVRTREEGPGLNSGAIPRERPPRSRGAEHWKGLPQWGKCAKHSSVLLGTEGVPIHLGSFFLSVSPSDFVVLFLRMAFSFRLE